MRILITLFLLSFILAGSQAQDGAIADIESVRLATQESIDQSVFIVIIRLYQKHKSVVCSQL